MSYGQEREETADARLWSGSKLAGATIKGQSMLQHTRDRIQTLHKELGSSIDDMHRLADKAFGALPEAPRERGESAVPATGYGGEAGEVLENLYFLEMLMEPLRRAIGRFAGPLD